MMEMCEKRQSILDCKGHALILGGPGSGKTTIALRKAVVRISEGLASGQSVLFLSFSRAAVARIGEATRQQVPKTLRGMLSMQTFHSLFWTLLSAHGYLLGAPRRLQILLPSDEQSLYGAIKKKDRVMANPEWTKWISERERMFREDGRIAFDLFAPNAANLLEKSAEIRRLMGQRFPLIIVDEAQDTDESAWRVIELVSPYSQVLCLADLEQQIFDHLPGVGPERIAAIKQSLKPLEVDLGSENHRSGDTEIAVFAQDVLQSRARGKTYEGVSSVTYNPKSSPFGGMLRPAIGILQRNIRKATGSFGRHIAILTHTSGSAAKISNALNNGSKPVRHKLAFDEAEAILTARFAAFLLEPRMPSDRISALATALDLLAAAKRSTGNSLSQQWQLWSAKASVGTVSKSAFVTAVLGVIDLIGQAKFSGDPAKDWTSVKRALRSSGNKHLDEAAKSLDYLVAFNRGRRIGSGLSAAWLRDGAYTGARSVLDAALAQDQVLGGVDDPPGIQVMTIHKSKGKQFDGVILIREGRHDGSGFLSSFVWRGDSHPHGRSRRILRVGITRAKAHTLLLQPAYPQCPLLRGHNL
jgi:DNA helicase-2/ATP-dependent DNA helicase PcrA